MDTKDSQSNFEEMALAVDAISIKLPIFWETNPKSWFTLVEAQFALKGITSELTKFYHALQAIDRSVICKVAHFTDNPPPSNQYSGLKETLLEAFGKSEAQQYRELFDISGLGDQKPTALLRQMQALVDPREQTSKLLRAFFLSRLPSSIQQALGRNPPDILDLAKAADEVLEASNFSGVFIQRVLRAKESQKHSGPKSRPLRCWYHATHGFKARKCLHSFSTPCDMSDTPLAGNAPADH